MYFAVVVFNTWKTAAAGSAQRSIRDSSFIPFLLVISFFYVTCSKKLPRSWFADRLEGECIVTSGGTPSKFEASHTPSSLIEFALVLIGLTHLKFWRIENINYIGAHKQSMFVSTTYHLAFLSNRGGLELSWALCARLFYIDSVRIAGYNTRFQQLSSFNRLVLYIL